MRFDPAGLLAYADATHAVTPGLSEGDPPAMTLTELGMAAVWAGRFEDGDRHLDPALVKARRIGRPRLELLALLTGRSSRSFVHARPERRKAREAIELAQKHGLEEDVYVAFQAPELARGRPARAMIYLRAAERMEMPLVMPHMWTLRQRSRR